METVVAEASAGGAVKIKSTAAGGGQGYSG